MERNEKNLKMIVLAAAMLVLVVALPATAMADDKVYAPALPIGSTPVYCTSCGYHIPAGYYPQVRCGCGWHVAGHPHDCPLDDQQMEIVTTVKVSAPPTPENTVKVTAPPTTQCPACGQWIDKENDTHSCPETDSECSPEGYSCPICDGQLVPWEANGGGGLSCPDCGSEFDYPDDCDDGDEAETAAPVQTKGTDGSDMEQAARPDGSTTSQVKAPTKESSRDMLPFTGGNAALWVLIGGLVMAMGAAVALVNRKRQYR